MTRNIAGGSLLLEDAMPTVHLGFQGVVIVSAEGISTAGDLMIVLPIQIMLCLWQWDTNRTKKQILRVLGPRILQVSVTRGLSVGSAGSYPLLPQDRQQRKRCWLHNSRFREV